MATTSTPQPDLSNKAISTQEGCIAALVRIRWPDGFVCPGCGGRAAKVNARGLFRCSGCQKQTSVVSGTVMTGTHLPLVTWFSVMREVANSADGISAGFLSRPFGGDEDPDDQVRISYKSAWTILQKLRGVMKPAQECRFRGRVEIGVEALDVVINGIFGRVGKQSIPIFVAANEKSNGSIREIRMQQTPNLDEETLLSCLNYSVENESSLVSSEESPFDFVAKANFNHKKHSKHYIIHINRIMAELNNWLASTFRGEQSEKHIQSYLDEFTFHFNHRCLGSSPEDILLDLVHRVVQGKPRTFQQIVQACS